MPFLKYRKILTKFTSLPLSLLSLSKMHTYLDSIADTTHSHSCTSSPSCALSQVPLSEFAEYLRIGYQYHALHLKIVNRDKEFTDIITDTSACLSKWIAECPIGRFCHSNVTESFNDVSDEVFL